MLYLASLCCDLGHLGKTNKFMVWITSRMGVVYAYGTLVNHHFSQTVTIQHNGGHGIFRYQSSDECKMVIGDM